MKAIVNKLIDEKTLKVTLSLCKKDKKYRKYRNMVFYRMVHSDLVCQVGDSVVLSQSKPISRRKSWIVVQKIVK